VGIFERLRPGHNAQRTAAASNPAGTEQPHAAGGEPNQTGYVVLDVETTGLSPRSDRILEIAVLRCNSRGHVLSEWVARCNPDGPVGATHIHGITDADVRNAPRFATLVPELNARMGGLAVVAHNAPFDISFLRAEFARAGWKLPWLPSLCTLEASWYYLPQLDRRRLGDCCLASGIRTHGAHSALGDARATATLLASYLDPEFGNAPLVEHLDVTRAAMTVTWPTKGGAPIQVTASTRRPERTYVTKPPAPTLVEALAQLSLNDALDEGAPEGAMSYLELLATALEDGELSVTETAALAELATLYELSPDDVAAANRGFLLALAHEALQDGKVSRAEREELRAIAELLDLDPKLVLSVLDHAEAARNTRMSEGLRPLPADWSFGDPLRVGNKVVFTGCDDAYRDRLEKRSEALGVRVIGAVSRQTAMLVTDGTFSGGKAADASALATRVVHPDQFAILLTHLQPALPRKVKPVAVPRPT
jgi:DNA polymerase-3 subunit epsilon